MDGSGRGGVMRMLRTRMTDAARSDFRTQACRDAENAQQMKVVRDLRNQLREAATAENYDAARVKAINRATVGRHGPR